MFFTDRGQVYTLKVFQVPEGTRTAKGRNVVNLLPLKQGEKVTEITTVPKNFDDHYLVFSTKRGLIKKSKLSDYGNVKASGIRAIKVNDDDAVLSVRVTDGTKDILLCASSGKIIRFSEADCRPLGRVSQVVKGIAIDGDDEEIGMAIIDDGSEILSITSKGYGKRSSASEYRKQSRGNSCSIRVME